MNTRPVPDSPPLDYERELSTIEKLRALTHIEGRGHSTTSEVQIDRSINKSITTFVKKNTDLLLGLFLGLALIEGAALFFEWRYKAQQQELKRYELSDFVMTHFNPLESQVKSDHDLIQSYGLQKAVLCRSN